MKIHRPYETLPGESKGKLIWMGIMHNPLNEGLLYFYQVIFVSARVRNPCNVLHDRPYVLKCKILVDDTDKNVPSFWHASRAVEKAKLL